MTRPALRIVEQEPRDYRQWLNHRHPVRALVERTTKKPGEYEFVWKDGRYQAVRIEEAA